MAPPLPGSPKHGVPNTACSAPFQRNRWEMWARTVPTCRELKPRPLTRHCDKRQVAWPCREAGILRGRGNRRASSGRLRKDTVGL